MPMNGPQLKALAQTTVYSKLKAVFEPDVTAIDPTAIPKVDAIWQKIADAVSDAMLDVVSHIQGNAMVQTSLTSPAVVVAGPSGPESGSVTNPAATGTVS